MKRIPRRTLLQGGVASAAAIGLTSNAVGGPDHTAMPTAERATISGPIMSVASRTALRNFDPIESGHLVFLDERGREGLFRCVLTSSVMMDIDPLQGLFVPTHDPQLTWARVWDGTQGRPEWFGALGNNPAADCAEALEACHKLCPVMQLSQADYFIRRTIHFDQSWRTISGQGHYATNQGQGTRIILQQAAPGIRTDDIVVLGSVGRPSGDLVTETHVSNLILVRDGPSQPHASGDLAHYPTGMRCAYVSHCTVSGVASLESSVGFYLGGVVYTKIDDCFAQRTQAGEGKGADRAAGYLLDGRVRFGYPGGNASLYMDRCVAAEQHARHVEPSGLIALGAFVDSFIDRFESARIDTGMAFHASGARGFGQTIDLHIRYPVLDGCGRFGLDLNLDATASACVEIIDPYITPAGDQGDRGILVRDGAGLVTITGGQVLGDFAGGSLFISRTRGVRVQGLKISQSIRPAVITESSGLHLEPQISNYAKTSPNPAISASSLSRSVVIPIIIGFDLPSFEFGINLDSLCHHVHIDGSSIDPLCLSKNICGKVVFNFTDARNSIEFNQSYNILSGVKD